MSSRLAVCLVAFYIRVEVAKLSERPTMKRPVSKVSSKNESYLAWRDGKIMLFRKPPTVRRMETLLSVGISIQLVVCPLVGAVLTGNPFWAIVVLVGMGWVFWFLYRVVGPNDFRLDGERLTYDRMTGWPWKPMTRSGPFSDIKGVCLSPNNNVILLVAKPGKALERVIIISPSLASAGSSSLVIDRSYIAESHAFAEEIHQVYGFPIVPYPR
ncbi:MAG: hypothetical protein ACRYFS_04600 [Janthinobacterium lividum]